MRRYIEMILMRMVYNDDHYVNEKIDNEVKDDTISDENFTSVV